MLRKFIYFTGALDYLVGLGTLGGAFANGDPQQVATMIPLGAFLCMAAALLMWASQDLAVRGCVVVWQALVRLSAVLGILVGMQMGIVASIAGQYGADPGGVAAGMLSVCAFDGVIATVYIVGTSRLEGHSLLGLLRGQPAR